MGGCTALLLLKPAGLYRFCWRQLPLRLVHSLKHGGATAVWRIFPLVLLAADLQLGSGIGARRLGRCTCMSTTVGGERCGLKCVPGRDPAERWAREAVQRAKDKETSRLQEVSVKHANAVLLKVAPAIVALQTLMCKPQIELVPWPIKSSGD